MPCKDFFILTFARVFFRSPALSYLNFFFSRGFDRCALPLVEILPSIPFRSDPLAIDVVCAVVKSPFGASESKGAAPCLVISTGSIVTVVYFPSSMYSSASNVSFLRSACSRSETPSLSSSASISDADPSLLMSPRPITVVSRAFAAASCASSSCFRSSLIYTAQEVENYQRRQMTKWGSKNILLYPFTLFNSLFSFSPNSLFFGLQNSLLLPLMESSKKLFPGVWIKRYFF